jgi:hypothetical protein
LYFFLNNERHTRQRQNDENTTKKLTNCYRNEIEPTITFRIFLKVTWYGWLVHLVCSTRWFCVRIEDEHQIVGERELQNETLCSVNEVKEMMPEMTWG